jgi:signal transduction histidine kinase
VQRVIHSIKARPDFQQIAIHFVQDDRVEGWFDAKKLERALYNLLLNACEAVSASSGRIEVDLQAVADGAEIRVSDNGRGIPELIRDRLFQPFVSSGKENGTGLGLTVVQKIVQDHGGDVAVERTSGQGTVFKVVLPLVSSSSRRAEVGTVASPPLSRAGSIDTP